MYLRIEKVLKLCHIVYFMTITVLVWLRKGVTYRSKYMQKYLRSNFKNIT